MNARVWLLVALALFTTFYIVILVSKVLAARRAAGQRTPETDTRPTAWGVGTGFVTNFFDTLGIGSFATTTAIFRFRKMVTDDRIPSTLNIGHTLPTIAQAFIFTLIVQVDARTLVLMIIAAVLGAWLGAGIVARMPRKAIRLGMGFALITAATFMLLTQLKLLPGGGDALALGDGRLAAGLVGNFALGALMTLGIGLYAPCMVLVSLLGMSPTAAFPIMMGSCAFLMPVASARFIRENRFDLRTALGLALGGIPAVLIAAFIVKSLPLATVRWLVVAVVLYAAIGLIRAGMTEADTAGVAEAKPTAA
jgi:uncharacterized membrane protein YfcA